MICGRYDVLVGWMQTRGGSLMKMAIALAALLIALAPPIEAQMLEPDPDDFEWVLYPFGIGSRGGVDSRWANTQWMRNISDQTLRVTHLRVPNFSGGSFPQEFLLQPDESRMLELAGGDAAGFDGVYIFVERGHAEEFDYSQRVFETSQQNHPGIEIPVFTESDLRPRLSFLSVVPTPRHRVMLRVYDPLIRPEGMLRIVVTEQRNTGLPQGPGQVVLEEIVPFTEGKFRLAPPNHEIPNWPSQIQRRMDLSGFPQGVPYVVDVYSMTEGVEICGFITITDNVTQEVQVVTSD